MIIWSQTALISHSLVMLVVGRPVCEIQVSTREKIKNIPIRKIKKLDTLILEMLISCPYVHDCETTT